MCVVIYAAKIAREEMLHCNATDCDATSLSGALGSCQGCYLSGCSIVLTSDMVLKLV
jgi:hypothetical protein